MLFTRLLFSIALQVFCNHVQGTLVQRQNGIKDGGDKERVAQGNGNSEVGATTCFGQHVFYGKDNEKHCFGPELDENLKPVKHESNLGTKGKLRLRRDGETTAETISVSYKKEEDDQNVESEEDETEYTKPNTSVDGTAKPADKTIPSGVSAAAEEEGCPTSCPPGDMMVCGRCQHDRYHTYLSACHVRMHACKYPHHAVQLVSRQPCGQFGPMNMEFNIIDGKIYQPMEQSLLHISGYN